MSSHDLRPVLKAVYCDGLEVTGTQDREFFSFLFLGLSFFHYGDVLAPRAIVVRCFLAYECLVPRGFRGLISVGVSEYLKLGHEGVVFLSYLDGQQQ